MMKEEFNLQLNQMQFLNYQNNFIYKLNDHYIDFH